MHPQLQSHLMCDKATSYAWSAIFLTASSILRCRDSEVLLRAIIRMIMSGDWAEGSCKQ